MPRSAQKVMLFACRPYLYTAYLSKSRLLPVGIEPQANLTQVTLLVGLGVFSSWLGGLPGWLSGGWWLEKRNKTEREVNDLKSRELSNGRLAMYVCGCC